MRDCFNFACIKKINKYTKTLQIAIACGFVLFCFVLIPGIRYLSKTAHLF